MPTKESPFLSTEVPYDIVLQLQDPICVRHMDYVVLFARLPGVPTSQIYYNVRGSTIDADGDIEFAGWRMLDLAPAKLRPGSLPATVRVGGMSLITIPNLGTPTVATPADSPFQAVSDDRYLYLFRPSTLGTLYVNRFLLVSMASDEPDASRKADTPPEYDLQPAWEVRYERSGLRDTPSGPRDSLAYRDMNGNPFVEPTTEIVELPKITAGNFSVNLVPVANDGTRRWQFFVADATAGSIASVSFPQVDSGLPLLGLDKAISFSFSPALTVGQSSVPLACTGGIDFTIYGEQEPLDAADDSSGSLRRTGRGMLVVPVKATASGLKAGAAVFDFGILGDGTIPPIPAGTHSPLIDGTLANNTFTPAVAPTYPISAGQITVVGGVTLYAYVLGQVQPSCAPNILQSGDGLVHLYHNGALIDGATPFLVAQYNPEATRAIVPMAWTAGVTTGTMDFVASRTGTTMAGLTVATTPATVGAAVSDLCNVTVNYGSAAGIGTETWIGVPRRLDAMMAILNGQATSEAEDPGVIAGTKTFYDYTGTRNIARIPLVASGSTTGTLDLVSARSDVLLSSVNVGPIVNSASTLTIAFAAGSNTITQTWSGVPTNPFDAAAFLGGDSAIGNYTPGANDSAAIAISATGGPILLFLKPGVTASNISVTVGKPVSGAVGKVDVTLKNGNTPHPIPNLPNDPTQFCAALMQNADAAAVFAVASPGSVPGTVQYGTSSPPLDLRSLSALFSVLPPSSSDPLGPGAVTAAKLQGHTQSPPVANPFPESLVGAMTICTNYPANGVAPTINVPQQVSVPASATPVNGQWMAAPAQYSLDTNGTGAMSISTTDTSFKMLDLGPEMTFEAWIKPEKGSSSTLVAFNGSPQQSTNGLVPSYTVGTFGQRTLRFELTTSQSLCSSILVNPPASSNFPPNRAFTWEMWINPDAVIAPTGQNGSFVQFYDPNASNMLFEIGIDSTLKPIVVTYDGTNSQTWKSPTAIPGGSDSPWTHLALAAAYDAKASEWNLTLFIDATTRYSFKASFQLTAGTQIYLGGSGNPADPTFAGEMSEVRLWSVARPLWEIENSMRLSLTGEEPGLLGYWQLSETPKNGQVYANSCHATGKGMEGVLSILTPQPVNQSPKSTFVGLVAGVAGGTTVQANAFLWDERWNHVAMSYRAGTAVKLDARQGDYVDCGDSESLNFGNSMSLEAWIEVPAFQKLPSAIASKWGAAADVKGYWLGLDATGRLMGQVCVDNSVTDSQSLIQVTASGGASVTDGKTHHVAMVFSTLTESQNNAPSTTATVTLYIDGVPAGSTPLTVAGAYSLPIQSVATNFVIGGSDTSDSVDPSFLEPFNGMITGVRAWSIPLRASQIKGSMEKRQAYPSSGAVSSWWFQEQRGSTAADDIGDNDGTLSRNDLWTLNGFLSTPVLYANGRRLVTTSPAPTGTTPSYLGTDQQLTIGGYVKAGTLESIFGKGIDEVRIWNIARSDHEIQGLQFSSLSGDENGLVGYWNFQNQSLADKTGNGNNATLIGTTKPTLVPTAAPVGNEAPYVRNAYGGAINTDFQIEIVGTPSVVEFGGVARRLDGHYSAALERGYYFVSESLRTPPGFIIGSLRLTYLGQLQTGATLLGYIEGAPPVPSENLSRPFYMSTAAPFFNYFGASSLTLTQTDGTTYSFSSSDSVAGTYEASLSVGPAFSFKAAANPPFVWTKVASAEGAILFKEQSSTAEGESQDLARSSGWTETITDTIALRGDWEPDAKDGVPYLNSVIGRRFVPANIGYALVSSQTADLFAMQLSTTGAMVGRVMIPNLAIPPDKNIVTFKIDPKYVKNGTLDGKVGLVNDPDYPNADVQRGSYFNPLEAYQLKARIEKQNTELSAYYEQFNVLRGQTYGNADVTFAAKMLSGVEKRMFENRTTDTVRRSIVNSYVWSANGGLHAEEEQFADTRTMTYSGFMNDTWSAGPSFAGKILGGAPISKGVQASLDLMFGKQVNVSLTKSKEETTGFGLSVSVLADPILLGWDAQALKFTHGPCPGKVQAYRFNAFQLAPSPANSEQFENVVDANWLKSDDPNAVVLRNAKIKGTSVWRVLYRTTYVSRVPPAFDAAPNQTVAPQSDRVIDASDNAELILMVVNALGKQAITSENIGKAIATVMAPTTANTPSVLGKVLPWWEAFLVTTRPGPSHDAKAAAWLQSLLYDTLTYMVAGFANGDIKPMGKKVQMPHQERSVLNRPRPTAV